jgi:hypothetical protein
LAPTTLAGVRLWLGALEGKFAACADRSGRKTLKYSL